MGDTTERPPDGDDFVSEVRDAVEVELFGAERLAFFTDAVVAIAITLLALNLEVPSVSTWSALGPAIAAHADGFLAFLISFFIIANAWLSHHALFGYVKSADRRLMSLNLLWLLLIVVAPFFTRVVVDEDVFFELRFIAYAVLQVLLAGLMWRLVRHAVRSGLVLDSTPPEATRNIVARSAVVAIPFALSIPVVFIPGVGDRAYFLWYFGPSVTALISRYLHRRRLARTGRSNASDG